MEPASSSALHITAVPRELCCEALGDFTRMSIPRIFGLAFALLLSSVAMVIFLFGLMISAHEPGSHSVPQWILGLAIASVPFLFTFWIVYRCFCTDEMRALEILGWIVKPQALLRAIVAELCLLVAVVASYFVLISSL